MASTSPKITLSENKEEYIVPPHEKNRLLAHLSTDKPVYKPGEVMFIEIYLIDALTKEPKLKDGFLAPEMSIHKYETGEKIVS